MGDEPLSHEGFQTELQARARAARALERADAEHDLSRLEPELEATGACHVSENLVGAAAVAAAPDVSEGGGTGGIPDDGAGATQHQQQQQQQQAKIAEGGAAAEGEGETQQQEDGLAEGGEASGAASGEAVAPLSSSTVESFSPSWDPYSNDVWRMRTQSLERFVRAARTVIYRARAAKRLVAIRAALGKATRPGEEGDEGDRGAAYIAAEVMRLGVADQRFVAVAPSELLASSRIHHFAWPLYRAQNFRSKAPLPEGEHGALEGVAPLALKVPLRFSTMGYKPEPLEPLDTYTPTMADQPLLTGAPEEETLGDMPRAVEADGGEADDGGEQRDGGRERDGASQAVGMVGEARAASMDDVPTLAQPVAFMMQDVPDARLQPFPVQWVSEGFLIPPPALDARVMPDSAGTERTGVGSLRALAASGEPLLGTSWLARREQQRARPIQPPRLMGGVDTRDVMSECGEGGADDEEGAAAEAAARTATPATVASELAKLMAEVGDVTSDLTTPATRVRQAADRDRLERRRALLGRVPKAVEEFDAKVKDPRLKLA